jgi:RNA polymerase sigma-70 factor (ECF subfamily)
LIRDVVPACADDVAPQAKSIGQPEADTALSISTHEASLSRRETCAATVELEARLRSMVNEYSDFVARTLLTAGVPQSDVDDEVQGTFMIAARRLEDVRPGAERGFLYRVARHTAAHAQRTRRRRREIPSGDLPEVPDWSAAFASPESLAQRRQMWTLLAGVLDRMRESLRAVFVLHDLEGMPRNEIAALLNLPDGTVASRLRLARREVRALFARKFASVRKAPQQSIWPPMRG